MHDAVERARPTRVFHENKCFGVGEAPCANEDQECLPFVGRAVMLLDKMLAAINLDRKKVYISNIVNYRPPDNRRPTDEEIKRYLPFITKHIEIINPKILVLLGSTAMNALIGNNVVISKMRGKWYEIEINEFKIYSIVSFHPAYLLRQPDQKKFSWMDLKMVREKLKELNAKWDETEFSRYWKNHGINEITARTGIHTGSVIAGNIGTVSYTHLTLPTNREV